MFAEPIERDDRDPGVEGSSQAPSGPSGGAGETAPTLITPRSQPPPPRQEAGPSGTSAATGEVTIVLGSHRKLHRDGPTLGSTREPAADAKHLHDARCPPDGAMLGGTYRVLGRLGEGAMGVILLAQDEQLQRKVAIKLLRSDHADDHAMQARLLDEGRAMARVHHPNVVEIYAFGEHPSADGGVAPYFVMQYVEGVTLDAYARERGGPPLGRSIPRGIDEALSLIDQMCLGVSAIHASGIAHRDLKPSNILVGPALRVVVADLGLAKRVTHDEHTFASFSGTPAFLAPEVAMRRNLDPSLLPRTDVYALGLIAYWLLVGRVPFEGRNAIELFKQHAYKPPPRPSELRPELPPSFDEPLLAALEKDPAARTESAEALRWALLAARDEAPMSCAPMRVIVADDDPDFRSFVVDLLASALPRAQIEALPDGEAALRAIKEERPALAVFDLDMPGLDGISLTSAVRALPRGDFPIIVATGTGSAADWQRLSRLGASAFLVKPFDAGQLITLARGLVGVAAQSVRP